MLLLDVAPTSPAGNAGLLPGDILLAADGIGLATVDDLTAALRRAGPAGTLTLDVGRGGRRTVHTTLLAGAATARRAA